jgi:hypothetical protein
MRFFGSIAVTNAEIDISFIMSRTSSTLGAAEGVFGCAMAGAVNTRAEANARTVHWAAFISGFPFMSG